LKAIEAIPDPFLKHNPTYIIVGDTCYESEDFDSWRLKHIPTEWIGWSSQKTVPANTKILIFRKVSQKPSTMIDHPLVQQHWH
jgi:hypothetical protein